MRIAQLTSSVTKDSGGLFYVPSGLAGGLIKKGVRVQGFGLAGAAPDPQDNPWENIPLERFSVRGPSFFSYAPKMLPALSAASLDVVHLHGLWMYSSRAAWRWRKQGGKALLISPHGMLDPWALGNSGWKKKLALSLYEGINLRDCDCLHAGSQSEYQAFRNMGLRRPVALLPNGVHLPSLKGKKLGTKKILLFLGRLHRKKNILSLVRAWNQLKAAKKQGWVLRIAGWGDTAYAHSLKEQAGSDIEFVPGLYGREKEKTFCEARGFILPSLSEGLPMAVLNAWSYRLPVLMSGACNLPQGFSQGAALDSGISIESIARSLEDFLSMPIAKQRRMGQRGLDLIEKEYTWDAVSEKMLTTYRWLLHECPKPAWVRQNEEDV